jgi:hypothetical protein
MQINVKDAKGAEKTQRTRRYFKSVTQRTTEDTQRNTGDTALNTKLNSVVLCAFSVVLCVTWISLRNSALLSDLCVPALNRKRAFSGEKTL